MYVYGACLFCFLSVVVTMWGSGNVCCVAAVVKDSASLNSSIIINNFRLIPNISY